jgi:hypothetical protein
MKRLLSPLRTRAIYFIDEPSWEHMMAARLAITGAKRDDQPVARGNVAQQESYRARHLSVTVACKRPWLPPTHRLRHHAARRPKSLRSLPHILNANDEERSERPAALSRHDAR